MLLTMLYQCWFAETCFVRACWRSIHMNRHSKHFESQVAFRRNCRQFSSERRNRYAEVWNLCQRLWQSQKQTKPCQQHGHEVLPAPPPSPRKPSDFFAKTNLEPPYDDGYMPIAGGGTSTDRNCSHYRGLADLDTLVLADHALQFFLLKMCLLVTISGPLLMWGFRNHTSDFTMTHFCFKWHLLVWLAFWFEFARHVRACFDSLGCENMLCRTDFWQQ